MTIDVVIGNPPYSDKSKASNKLWGKFVEKALVHSDTVCMIVPTGWLSNTNAYHELISSKLVYADVSNKISEFFGSVGGTQKFGWFIISNNKNENGKIKFDDVTMEIDFTSIKCTPVKSTDSRSYTIVQKMESSNSPSYIWVRTTAKDLGSGVSMPMAKGVNFVITYQENDCLDLERYFVKTDKQLGEAIATNLNLKLYKHLRWVIRSGPAIAGNFKHIRIPDTKMTDEELYTHFNLTQEEKEYIEANVK